MRPLVLTLAVAFGASGCLGDIIPPHQASGVGPDMAEAPSGTGGNGASNSNGGSGGSGGGGAAGSGGSGGGGSMTMSGADGGTMMAAGDGGTTTSGGGGTAAFGALCTVNGDCQSNMCGAFVMMTVHRCTKSCTVATQATDCPAPSDGTCNNNGQCKFDQ